MKCKVEFKESRASKCKDSKYDQKKCKKKKERDHMSINLSNNGNCTLEKNNSNINHEERDCHNRIIDKVREKSKIKMDAACKNMDQIISQ